MFKVIAVDNYNRETVDDWLLCDNIAQERNAEKIAQLMNNAEGDHASWFFKAVPADHVLSVWEP